jgi:hypothetical protein
LVTAEIIRCLHAYKRKPYLPVWGELFALLYGIKRRAEQENRAVEAYAIGNDVVVFDPDIRKFRLRIGEITFCLSIEELTDALLRGAFVPKTEAAAEEASVDQAQEVAT